MGALLAAAGAVAIVGATVHPGAGPPLEDAVVLLRGGRVAAVGRGIALPEGAQVIDARGAVVTPGLVDAASRLGLVEIGLEPSSVEGTLAGRYAADPVRAALRVADTWDPDSTAIPVARGGGLTSAVAIPMGGVVSGQSAWVALAGREPLRRAPAALHVDLTPQDARPGARAGALLALRRALEDARDYAADPRAYAQRRLRELAPSSADLAVLARALRRELPVVIAVDRAASIRSALALVREFELRAVLLGASEGWQVADDIAAAAVPVLVDPFANLPSHFGALRARADNAALLHRAGVRVAFTLLGEAHRAHRLRQAAGVAVANGFPWQAALAAITRVPAEIFGLEGAGVLERGALGDVAVWNGDPLELTSWPTRLFVGGEEVPLRSRQDRLTERYLELPAP